MVEGPATDAAFAIVFIVLGGLIAVGLAMMVRGFLTMYGIWGFVAECTASRDANITASVSQPRRRTIVIPIPAESIILYPHSAITAARDSASNILMCPFLMSFSFRL